MWGDTELMVNGQVLSWIVGFPCKNIRLFPDNLWELLKTMCCQSLVVFRSSELKDLQTLILPLEHKMYIISQACNVFSSSAKDVYRPPQLRGTAPSVKVVSNNLVLWNYALVINRTTHNIKLYLFPASAWIWTCGKLEAKRRSGNVQICSQEQEKERGKSESKAGTGDHWRGEGVVF